MKNLEKKIGWEKFKSNNKSLKFNWLTEEASQGNELAVDSIETEGGVPLGDPGQDSNLYNNLLMGEAVAPKSSAVLSRRGRSGVCVRIVEVAPLVGWKLPRLGGALFKPW